MNDKIFKITLAVLIGVSLGFVLLKGGGDGVQAEPTNHVYGATDAKVTLVEYGDFQCPACLRYYPALKQVKEKYKDQITFQFRNFPLTQIHLSAMTAHRAAEAASNQGKFWEMHDLLYERQQVWSQSVSPSSIIEAYAEELGLDLVQYNVDVSGEEEFAAISADIDEGQALGAAGTPTFVLNGEVIESPDPTLEAFSLLIDQALREANS